MAIKKGTEIPTIDVVLVSIKPYGDNTDEYILDTANKIGVEPQVENIDSVKLIVKGRLIAQKPPKAVVTGNTITLTDNVFNPEVVKILQGGTITTDQTTNAVTGYTPPVVGSSDSGSMFELNAYSSIYNAAGTLTGYEKITYPNCKGVPIALSSEDGVFRASDYTINSAPANNEAPYVITMVNALPTAS